MTDWIVPLDIDRTGVKDVWAPLTAFISKAQPGDSVHFPANSQYRCDRSLVFAMTGVKFFFEGATFIQTSARPYGAVRSGGVITGGKHLRIQGAQLPMSCNYGYVSGVGIPNGTHIQLDSDRLGGVLDRVCVNNAGISVTFTSQQDRGRCGFEVQGTDLELHDAMWDGCNADQLFVTNLEAQHGVNFAGATNIQLTNISSNHMYGDGMYFTARGTKRTTYVTAVGGTINYNARSGLTPINCSDIHISKFTLDHVGRTAIDFEPPDAGAKMDRFFLTDSTIGYHRLTLLSSGGNVDAHVGYIELARNKIMKAPMVLWLVNGNNAHRRGPYTIKDNVCTYPNPFGGAYPTAAMICINNAIGATVTGNSGFILQDRYPTMAVCRSKITTNPVVVHDNQFTGAGIEYGPWI